MERKGDSQTLQTKFLLNVSCTALCPPVGGASSLGFRPSLSDSSCLKVIAGRDASRLSPEETTDDTAERGGGEGEGEEHEEEKEEEEEEESVGGPGEAADMSGSMGGMGEGEGDTVGERTGRGDCAVAFENGEGHC